MGLHDAFDGCFSMEEWMAKRSSEGGSSRLQAEMRWRFTLATCWSIWKAHYDLVYNQKPLNAMDVITTLRKIMGELQIYSRRMETSNRFQVWPLEQKT